MGKGWILTLLAALTVFSSPAPPPEAPAMEYRCLAVGIDRFVNEETTTPCSANNAETIAGLFRDCLPKGTKVTRRVNGPGSAEEMEDLIRVAFRGAGEQDTSFLYLSTHGVAWTEEDQEKAVLILSDGEREETLAPDTLRKMMDALAAMFNETVRPCDRLLLLPVYDAGGTTDRSVNSDALFAKLVPGKAELVAAGDVIAQMRFIEDRADQQHRRSAKRFCLVDHVLVDDKILAQTGDLYRRGDLRQILVTSQEPLRFRQHRHGIGPGSLILARDVQIGELGRDQPL